MIHSMINKIRQFKRSDKGNVSAEFVIMAPIMLSLMLIGIEIGVMTLRHTTLERSLDQTVRWVRLNTGAAPTHEQLKTMICSGTLLKDCEENLYLEMSVQDMRAWTDMNALPACVDQVVSIGPMDEYSFGQDNETVILRACAKFNPLFPGTKFAAGMAKDANGDSMLVSQSAFVQEPR